jgi:hypothetical protein
MMTCSLWSGCDGKWLFYFPISVPWETPCCTWPLVLQENCPNGAAQSAWFIFVTICWVILFQMREIMFSECSSVNCRSATSFTRILPLDLQYFTLRHLLDFLGNQFMMIGLCCFSMLFLPLYLLYHLEYLSKMFPLKSACRYVIEF